MRLSQQEFELLENYAEKARMLPIPQNADESRYAQDFLYRSPEAKKLIAIAERETLRKRASVTAWQKFCQGKLTIVEMFDAPMGEI